MNHGEIVAAEFGHRDFRLASERNRERRKKCKGKMGDSFAKLRAIGAVPGINRIEGFERGDRRVIHHAHQIEAGVGNGAGAIGKSDQRKHRTRRPHFGVFSARGFQFRKSENHVADRAGTDEKTSQDYFKPYSLRALSRSTIRASSTARSRVISSSCSMPVSAIPSASRPVTLAMKPASSQPESGGAKG